MKYNHSVLFSFFVLPHLVLSASSFTSACENDSLTSKKQSIHYIEVYENNAFKEKKPASEFPDSMRYRTITITQDNGERVTQEVPVARIEVLITGEDGKPTTPDKATVIETHDYAADGAWLGNNIMKRKTSAK